jgi:hypothetical protein
MSNLNPQQFRLFHGTESKIKGDYIWSSKQKGDEWDGDGPDAAFASSHLEDAARYGSKVYEVHPDDHMDYHGSGVYAAEGFKIKRKLKPEVVDRYSRVFGPMREEQERIAHGKWMHENNSITHGGGGKNGDTHISYDKEGNQHEVPVKSFMDCSECKKIKR